MREMREGLGLDEYARARSFPPGPEARGSPLMVGTNQQDASIDKHFGRVVAPADASLAGFGPAEQVNWGLNECV